MAERPPITAPALEALLGVVYRHHPRGMSAADARHQTSEESRRLACVHQAAAMACGKGFVPVPEDRRVAIDADVQAVVDALHAWQPFCQRCRRAFSDRVVWDESGPFFDPGYRVSVAQAGFSPPARIPAPGEGEPPSRQPGQPALASHDPVVCVVSVLAPVYAIFTYVPRPGKPTGIRCSRFPARYHDRIDTLRELAEDSLGFAQLGEDVLLHPVPDLMPFTSHLPMGATTLTHCLFAATLW